MDAVSLYTYIGIDFPLGIFVETTSESDVVCHEVKTRELGLLLKLVYDSE